MAKHSHDQKTVSVGGIAPGGDPLTKAAPSDGVGLWKPLVTRALSVAVGMLGLASIGLVAGTPHNTEVTAMSLSPLLGDTWLAPAGSQAPEPHTAHAADGNDAPASEREPPHAEQPVRDKPIQAKPAESEPSPPPNEEPARDAKPPPGVTADGKVILNTAGIDDLTRLPGIGKKRAEKVIELRTQLKRFRKPTDLLRVKGIGPKSLRKMLPHLVLDPPEEAAKPE